MSDEPGIIAGCLRGERAGYAVLVARYAGAVRSFLVRKLGDPERAEEAAQEAFVRAYEGLAGLRDRGKFASWVLGIAAKVAFEEGRRRKTEGGKGEERAERVRDAWGGGAGGGSEMERAVANLPEPYRGAVWLRYWAGMSCEAAAREQGVSIGTFTKRLSRAHELLRGVVGEDAGQATGKEREHELR